MKDVIITFVITSLLHTITSVIFMLTVAFIVWDANLICFFGEWHEIIRFLYVVWFVCCFVFVCAYRDAVGPWTEHFKRGGSDD